MISWLLQRSISLVPWKLRETIKHRPIFAYAQRRILESCLHGREFVHLVDAGPARGLRYPVVLPEDKGVWVGTYEAEFAAALASAVRPDTVCYDVGGWRGYYSGIMALAGASSVFVFEPLPENVLRIRKLAALNPELPIKLIESAVGDRVGTSVFTVMPDSSMGKLADSSFQSSESGVCEIEVGIVTLDSLIESGRIAPPEIVKIDVEGAELLVLQGFVSALKSHKPVLFLEIHSRELAKKCTGFLGNMGYGVVVLETRRPPDFQNEPTVCHLLAKHSSFCLS